MQFIAVPVTKGAEPARLSRAPAPLSRRRPDPPERRAYPEAFAGITSLQGAPPQAARTPSLRGVGEAPAKPTSFSKLLLCVSSERDVIKLIRCRRPCFRTRLLNSLDKAYRAGHMPENQKTFVVIQYLVVVCKALLIPYTIESFQDRNAGFQYSLRHL